MLLQNSLDKEKKKKILHKKHFLETLTSSVYSKTETKCKHKWFGSKNTFSLNLWVINTVQNIHFCCWFWLIKSGVCVCESWGDLSCTLTLQQVHHYKHMLRGQVLCKASKSCLLSRAFWQLNASATPNISHLHFSPARNKSVVLKHLATSCFTLSQSEPKSALDLNMELSIHPLSEAHL